MVNGTITTISQITGFLGLLEAGMGSVASVAFYKSFSGQENFDLTVVRNTIKKYYKKIAIISLTICATLSVILPIFLKNGFEFLFNFELVLIVGCGYFIQYYFGITEQLMLTADCRSYVVSLSQIVAVVSNFAASIFMITKGVDIRLVKLISAGIMMSRPIILSIYVKAKYKFSAEKNYDNLLIKQRWNNFGQSLAFYIHSQTDMIVIMLFLSVSENSVYGIYVAIISAIKTVIVSIISNFNPILGRVVTKNGNENEEVKSVFSKFVFLNNFLINVLFATTAVLIIPFMKIYSYGFDYNYVRPLFAVFMCLAEYTYLFRNPYNTIINVNGHFKETQNSAFLEAGINIVLSIILVNFLGSMGVVFATFIAMLYRMIYCVCYTNKKLLKLKWVEFAKSIVIFLITVFAVSMIIFFIDLSFIDNYLKFIIAGIITTIFFVCLQGILSIIFNKKEIKSLFLDLKLRRKK